MIEEGQELISAQMITLFRDEMAEDPRDAMEKVHERFTGQKRERLLELISLAAESSVNTLAWWNGFRDAGAKYMVVVEPSLKLLIRCEPIQ